MYRKVPQEVDAMMVLNSFCILRNSNFILMNIQSQTQEGAFISRARTKVEI